MATDSACSILDRHRCPAAPLRREQPAQRGGSLQAARINGVPEVEPDAVAELPLGREDRARGDADAVGQGLPGIALIGPQRFAGEPGGIRAVQVTVAAPADSGLAGARTIRFHITARQDPATRVSESSTFVFP